MTSTKLKVFVLGKTLKEDEKASHRLGEYMGTPFMRQKHHI